MNKGQPGNLGEFLNQPIAHLGISGGLLKMGRYKEEFHSCYRGLSRIYEFILKTLHKRSETGLHFKRLNDYCFIFCKRILNGTNKESSVGEPQG